MTTPGRPSARRGPSGAWNRLKAAPLDALDVYGLPSKGETKLNDPKAQEAYYNKIVERYLRFCAATGNAEDLAAAFEKMSTSQNDWSRVIIPLNSTPSTTAPTTKSTQITSSAQPDAAIQTISTLQPSNSAFTSSTDSTFRDLTSTAPSSELATIHLAMRKLRESLTATRRVDSFAQRAYIFIIHATILTQTWEAYQPALLYLLYHIHPHTPLTPAELSEHVGYHMLDLGCRAQAVGRAMSVKRAFFRDRVGSGFGTGTGTDGEGNANGRMVATVLRALVHDDWVRFWRLRRAVDGYARAIMSFAEHRVRVHVLKCLGRSYLSAERRFVERVCAAQWEDLVKAGCGWELAEEGRMVVIRRPKAK